MSDLSADAERLLRRLAEPGLSARRSPLDRNRLSLERSGAAGASLGAGHLPLAAASELVAAGFAVWRGTDAAATLELAAVATPERPVAVASIAEEGRRRTVLTDARESPLLWLRRRAGLDGKAQISDAQFAAGERLRADLTMASMLPRTTMNWEAASAPDERGPQARDPASASDAAIAARQRVRRACDRLGPALSGLAIDVCGFLKGLDQVERERGWPARSAKVVLGLALTGLAEHYGIADRGRRSAPIAAWRAADARPELPPA